MNLGLRQTGALTRRAITRTLRIPQAWVPSLFFPLMLMAIFSGSFSQAPGRIPGFPEVPGFLDFIISGIILQAVLISGTSQGAALAVDIEGGFFDRLVSSPVNRFSLVASRILANVAQGLVFALLFIGIAVIFGARFEAGVPGLLLVLVFAALLAAAAGSLGVVLALRSGSAEAAQGAFPLFFALMFFSSAFFPRQTMDGWFKTVADWNPISHVVEGMRVPIVGVGGPLDVVVGLVIVSVLVALGVAASLAALRRRIRGDF